MNEDLTNEKNCFGRQRSGTRLNHTAPFTLFQMQSHLSEVSSRGTTAEYKRVIENNSPSWKQLFSFKNFIGVQLTYTMLCYFQVYSKVTYIYIYPLFFRFFPHIGYYRILNRVPCAIQ